jgi:NAD(P)-dependent dehydrogenase (short-subunit alcohol dehydrogenase family)
MLRFSNRTCIVVGGSSGIGNAAVKQFISEGGAVFVLDKAILDDHTKDLHYLECDITNFTECCACIAHVHSEAKKIDTVFVSAGIHHVASIEETTIEALQTVIQTNLAGIFYILKAILPIMRQQKHGSIVLMGSDQSFIGKPSQAVYGATKAAILQLVKSTAIDYAKFNVRINCVCPGTTKTPMTDNALAISSQQTQISIDSLINKLTQNQLIRRFASADEIAKAALFLCSDDASFITGTSLLVDGGYTAQ